MAIYMGGGSTKDLCIYNKKAKESTSFFFIFMIYS